MPHSCHKLAEIDSDSAADEREYTRVAHSESTPIHRTSHICAASVPRVGLRHDAILLIETLPMSLVSNQKLFMVAPRRYTYSSSCAAGEVEPCARHGAHTTCTAVECTEEGAVWCVDWPCIDDSGREDNVLNEEAVPWHPSKSDHDSATVTTWRQRRFYLLSLQGSTQLHRNPALREHHLVARVPADMPDADSYRLQARPLVHEELTMCRDRSRG